MGYLPSMDAKAYVRVVFGFDTRASRRRLSGTGFDSDSHLVLSVLPNALVCTVSLLFKTSGVMAMQT